MPFEVPTNEQIWAEFDDWIAKNHPELAGTPLANLARESLNNEAYKDIARLVDTLSPVTASDTPEGRAMIEDLMKRNPFE